MGKETPIVHALDRRFLLIALAVFVLVAVATYLPVVGGKIPLPARLVTQFPPWASSGSQPRSARRAEFGDTVTLFYPWRTFEAAMVRRGLVPLWNPFILSGTPFVANTQSSVFYPLNVLFYTLPVPLAWTLKLMLTVIGAGLFTAMFIVSLGGTTTGAIFGGVAFALSGFMVVWQGQALIDAALWLPMICFAVSHLNREGASTASVALAGTAFALPVLAGHPETAIHIVLVGCLWFAWLLWMTADKHTILRRIELFGASGLLGVGLASIQLLPSVEWIGQINRPTGINWGSSDVYNLMTFLSRDISKTPNSAHLVIPESAAYVGLLTLLVAAFAIFSVRKREAAFFLAIIGIALAVVVGWGPLYRAVSHIPIIGGMKNWRLLAVVDFCLSVLAGLGLTSLTTRNSNSASLWITLAMAATLLCAGIWCLYHFTKSTVDWIHGPPSSALFLIAGVVILALRFSDRIRPKVFEIGIVALLCIEMVTFAFGYLTFAPKHEIYPDAPLFKFLRRDDPYESRVAVLGETYAANFGMMYGISEVGGWDESLRRTKQMLYDLSVDQLSEVTLSADKVAGLTDRRLDMLNTKYFVTNTYNDSYKVLLAHPDRFLPVFSDGPVWVFENRKVLHRAIFVPVTDGTIEVGSESTALNRLKSPSFNPEQTVILPAVPAEFIPGKNEIAGYADGGSAVSWIQHDVNELQLRVSAARSGVLVMSQIYYPGWRVFVDGRESSLLRPDYALIGVVVDRGSHIVTFRFEPTSFTIGASVTALSLVVLIFLLARAARTRRRERLLLHHSQSV